MSLRCPGIRGEAGFSLLEAVLALAITLVVMAMVVQTMGHAGDIYEAQTELAESSSEVLRALDDITLELGLAGQGLGDGVASVLPEVDGGAPARSLVTLRSNPGILATPLSGAVESPASDVGAAGASRFETGTLALVVSPAGRSEPAEVVRVGPASVGLRALASADGAFDPPFPSGSGTRLLGLREVRYFLEDTEDPSKKALVKDVLGVGRRVLTREATLLAFEYLTADGEPIAFAKVGATPELEIVRVRLDYEARGGAPGTKSLATAVTLRPSSGTVDFERRDLGFRLSRIFYPIDHPVAVASRIGADWAAMLASGTSLSRDPAYLYTFETERGFLSASVDDVIHLDDVRAPVGLAFGPESGPLAGSLFVAAWGIRIGHLMRLAPSPSGRFSADSEVTTFEGTEAIAQAGGIAFGVDDALYVTSREKGAIYRFRFDGRGRPSSPERVFDVTGAPGEIAEARDGHLYFVMNHGDRGSLWRMAFDETLAPVEPALVGPLSGLAVSLAADPVEGSLFALVHTAIGDFEVLELDRRFLSREPGDEGEQEHDDGVPEPIFSLREWQERLEEGQVEPRELPFPTQELPRRMEQLRTEELDFVAFDAQGSLYLGAKEKGLVLKFELDRPSGRYAVGVAGGVVQRGEDGAPTVRIHAWKK